VGPQIRDNTASIGIVQVVILLLGLASGHINGDALPIRDQPLKTAGNHVIRIVTESKI
jgi:hypothetical protein